MSDRIQSFLAKGARRADLVIAVLMLVAITMMLIPLPTGLVDIMITTNIAISLLILLAAIYVRHPLEFSSLPSVILIATLFRLAITITTTRLILLQHDAGQIVTAFGTFVVGGSIAVGLVVFLIITIAQFVVIAKGAERVAEVAARFTLDALPGKQMSIDAELRNGDIDQAEARRLRQRLEPESQLFGAMDGAMKFVKGDVIAGIVIILVNLIGGFAVGTLQHGMSLAEAASTYSLLTVGDGLVAQIPALLVAVASGTMITRVASSDGQDDLGQQITSQLLRDSRALGLASVILVGLSLVPGFPTVVFLILGAILGAGAYAVHRNATRQENTGFEEADLHAPIPVEPLQQKERKAVTASMRIIVRHGEGISESLSEAEFVTQTDHIRNEIYNDLGVEVPQIGLHEDTSIKPNHVRIDLEGAPIFEADVPVGRVKVEGDPSNLDLAGIVYEEGGLLGVRQKALWVDSEHVPALREAGLAYLSPIEMIGKWTADTLRLYAGHFVGIQETREMLSELEEHYEELVKEARETLPLQKISEVLRRLVAENVPIRNLRIILEAMVEWGQREQDAVLLTEYIRAALKRQISFRVADRNHIIAAYVLQPSAEEILKSAVQATSSGTFLNLSEEDTRVIVDQVQQALAETAADATPIVLTATQVRRHMRNLLVHNGLDLPVLSYQELASEFNVQPLATIAGLQSKIAARHSLPPLPGEKKRETAS